MIDYDERLGLTQGTAQVPAPAPPALGAAVPAPPSTIPAPPAARALTMPNACSTGPQMPGAPPQMPQGHSGAEVPPQGPPQVRRLRGVQPVPGGPAGRTGGRGQNTDRTGGSRM